jgi:large subunit ribosomal protein L21
MYAIVKTGGKQYRVERGQRLLVERLAVDEGNDVALEPILFRSDEVVLDAAGLADVTVTAKVLAHVRGEKLRVFKFKPKRGYKRRTGHRQDLTQIEVTDIARGKSRSATAASKAKPPAGATADAAATSAKPAAAKRPAAKATAPKPSAAKASAAKPAAGKDADVKPARAKPAGAKPAGAKRAPAKAKEEPSDGS